MGHESSYHTIDPTMLLPLLQAVCQNYVIHPPSKIYIILEFSPLYLQGAAASSALMGVAVTEKVRELLYLKCYVVLHLVDEVDHFSFQAVALVQQWLDFCK